VTGQLATAVAQQAAAQAVAAAAAVTAAQGAAAKASTSYSTSASDQSTSSTNASTPRGASTSHSSTKVTTTSSGSADTTDPALNSFLECVAQAESGGNYGAVSPNRLYMGAFQFSQSTWDTAAQAASRPDLVGVPPNRASRADQDTVAVALYALDGEQPWLGDRCSS
jgi:hypothetical protein